MKYLPFIISVIAVMLILLSNQLTYQVIFDEISDQHPEQYPNSQVIFDEISEYRQGSLQEKDDLCALASLRAYQSVTDWSHDGFFPLTKLYPQYEYLVENLERGYSDTKVVDAWLLSPTHKKNLDEVLRYGCVRCYEENCAFIGAN